MEPIQVILLGANSYSFNEQDTGRLIEGCNVHFINLESNEEENNVGHPPKKVTFPLEQFQKYGEIPYPVYANAYLEIDFRSKRPQLKITNFDPIKELKI